jgi:hypothetical protein
MVIEATEPLSTIKSHDAWESVVHAADYEFCLFDGLSRYYVASEHHNDLYQLLSYPACVHDAYVPHNLAELREATQLLRDQVVELTEQLAQLPPLREERERLEDELVQARGQEAQALASAVRWRQKAVDAWAQASTGSGASSEELVAARAHAHALSTELSAIKQTLSWRLTAPLRSFRRVVPRQTTAISSRQSPELKPRQTIS